MYAKIFDTLEQFLITHVCRFFSKDRSYAGLQLAQRFGLEMNGRFGISRERPYFQFLTTSFLDRLFICRRIRRDRCDCDVWFGSRAKKKVRRVFVSPSFSIGVFRSPFLRFQQEHTVYGSTISLSEHVTNTSIENIQFKEPQRLLNEKKPEERVTTTSASFPSSRESISFEE